jgi:hypothetical protein
MRSFYLENTVIQHDWPIRHFTAKDKNGNIKGRLEDHCAGQVEQWILP